VIKDIEQYFGAQVSNVAVDDAAAAIMHSIISKFKKDADAGSSQSWM
jgi:hypothetical protein